MECATDNIVIVNLEHAYALTEVIKTEQPDEVMITDEVVIKTEENNEDMWTEEVTIKKELPDDEYPFETVVVNPEMTDFSNVVSEPSINPLVEPVLEKKANVGFHSPINDQNQARLSKQELKRKKFVQDLYKENKILTRKNQIMKHNFKEYQHITQAKIDTLLDKNNALQLELNELDEMKKNYKLLEDQLFSLTKRMLQFTDRTLPKLSSEGIIGELKSQIDIKNKQQECVELRVKNLKESLERLKQVTTVVKMKQVGELQDKVNQEKSLIDMENMSQDNLVFQNNTKTIMDEYQKIKKKYTHSLLQKENQKQHINKLELKLQGFYTSISEMQVEKETLLRQIHNFKAKILRMKNKICDYCGM